MWTLDLWIDYPFILGQFRKFLGVACQQHALKRARVPHFITPLKQKRLPLGLLIDYSDYSERKHNEKQKKSAESTLKVPVRELNMPGQNGSDCSKIPH